MSASIFDTGSCVFAPSVDPPNRWTIRTGFQDVELNQVSQPEFCPSDMQSVPIGCQLAGSSGHDLTPSPWARGKERRNGLKSYVSQIVGRGNPGDNAV